MILPFRGYGYLVVVFYVGAFILTQLIVDSILDEGLYTSRTWPKYIAVAVGAILCWLVGRWLHSGVPRRCSGIWIPERNLLCHRQVMNSCISK